MRIVAMNGSPNVDGNTAQLLQTTLQAITDPGIEKHLLHASAIMKASGSPFCEVCQNPCPGTCYENTELADAYALLANSDAIILGSPVYFGTVSAPLKAFFDKSRRLRAQRALLNKVGAAVAVGAARFGGQETTLRALHDIMFVHGMILVGDGDSSMDCGHHGVAAQRPAESDAFALGRANSLAARIVRVAHATRSLR